MFTLAFCITLTESKSEGCGEIFIGDEKFRLVQIHICFGVFRLNPKKILPIGGVEGRDLAPSCCKGFTSLMNVSKVDLDT